MVVGITACIYTVTSLFCFFSLKFFLQKQRNDSLVDQTLYARGKESGQTRTVDLFALSADP